ncbi:MAG: hypothetical protein H6Q95_416 [Nitrospirae bacterium]|nr:hypothetical protein [Nitrospirota bacterium]
MIIFVRILDSRFHGNDQAGASLAYVSVISGGENFFLIIFIIITVYGKDVTIDP